MLENLEKLQKRLEELKEAGRDEEYRCLDFLLHEMLTMSFTDLRSFKEEILKKPKQRGYSAAVAVVGGDPGELRDDRTILVGDFDALCPEDLEAEAGRVCDSIRKAKCLEGDAGAKVIIPKDAEDAVCTIRDKIQNGGSYFFYFTGHGFEVNGSFYFIVGKPKSLMTCLSLDDLVEQLKTFCGCNFIFCINSCRSSLQGEFKKPALRKSLGLAESVSFNNWVFVFPTSSGVPAKDEGAEATGFEQVTKMMIPKLTNIEGMTQELTEFARRFAEAEQDSPSVYFFPSVAAKPPTTGYTLLWYESHKDMQQLLPNKTIQVTDHRKDHRRRVNRMTAPTVKVPSSSERSKPPVCVILDHTAKLSLEDYLARFIRTGMSANYVISTAGERYLLVEEERMAWDYNLAYWGGSGFIEGEGFLATKGKINELKSYSISIALEGKNHQKYSEEQYKSLLSLMDEIRLKWSLEAWNVLGADEVVQDPEQDHFGPSPSFEWNRLSGPNFSLRVEASHGYSCKDHVVAVSCAEKLEAWGYAFGPQESGVRQTFLRKRKEAFCHRYNIAFADEAKIIEAVDSLLQQKKKPSDS